MRRFFMFFLGIACFLFSSACGMLSEAPPAPPARRAPVEGYMASAAMGDSTRLDDPAFGKNVTVVMENSFTSASGEECRRASVIVGAKEAEVVVVCRDASGQWAMVPRVWGQGIEKP